MLGFFSGTNPNTNPFAVVRSQASFEDAGVDPDPIPLLGRTLQPVKRKTPMRSPA